MNSFIPDLVVEVTKACNRACVGCYAPNVISKKGANELLEEQPKLFIGLAALNSAFNDLRGHPEVIAVRGGEPSLHPKLPLLLKMIKTKGQKVFLETHGRWLLPESVSEYSELVREIQMNNIIVKISFDSMHGLKEVQLQSITEMLIKFGIDYRIAITEKNIVDYTVSRSLCAWIPEEKVLFQLKASSDDQLIKPSMGTITSLGEIQKTLTNKFELEERQGLALA